MCATRTQHKHTRQTSPGIGTRRRGCRPPSTAMAVDEVIQWVGSGRPMTVAELWHAAAILASALPSGRMDVHVARVRVAVRLEELGA